MTIVKDTIKHPERSQLRIKDRSGEVAVLHPSFAVDGCYTAVLHGFEGGNKSDEPSVAVGLDKEDAQALRDGLNVLLGIVTPGGFRATGLLEAINVGLSEVESCCCDDYDDKKRIAHAVLDALIEAGVRV